MSSGGKTSRLKFNSCEGLISKVGGKKFNQFEARCDAQTFTCGLRNSSVVSVTAVFTPAATSDMWFSYLDWPTGGGRLERTRRMNAKAREVGIQYYGVKKPNLAEIVLVIESAHSKDDVLDAVAKRLAERVTPDFLEISPFGCCDAGDAGFFAKMEAGVLMTEGIRIMAKLMPPAYPQLGTHFDRLHPLMFGDRQLCCEIGHALGADAEVVGGAEKQNYGIVRITSSCDMTLATKRASKWLLLAE